MLVTKGKKQALTGRAAESGTNWSDETLLSSTLLPSSFFTLFTAQGAGATDWAAGFMATANTEWAN